MKTHCYRCDGELLPNDDVDSPRYKEMGCLQCQVSLAAEHEYGKDVIRLLMVITKEQAIRILELINGASGGSEIEVHDEDYLFAKKLIEHFHIPDYGWLLTEYADLCERKRLVPALPVIDCAHTRTKPYDIGFDDGICCADCGRMLS